MRSDLAVAAVLASHLALASPLVGPSVGNADLLVSEGSRLYNEKKYDEAAQKFLDATRADPSNLNAYLQLARSNFAARKLRRACYVYRSYLKAAPDTPERKKAQAESELCQRQLRTAKKEPPDPTPKYVEGKAAFYAALEAKRLVGSGSAAEELTTLVETGFVSPELGEMAQKLRDAAVNAADELHRRAIAGEKVPPEQLRQGRPLYQLATDVGQAPPEGTARSAFLDGLAAMQEADYARAESLFADAARLSPSVSEYRHYRAMALLRGGDAKGALAAMEADLPGDPRTAVLRAHLSLGDSPQRGASELERLLFSRRFEPAR